MFVLLIGLMGVGAMIPAGRYEIMQGVKTDYGTTVGRAAVRDLKTRGMLNPTGWQGILPPPIWQPANVRPFFINGANTVQPFVAIDPLGCAAAGFGSQFPFGAPSSLSLTRIYPSASLGTGPLADPIFRCSDDLVTVPGVGRDMPPTQYMMGGTSKRSSEGNYSWLATIATDPTSSALNTKAIVSIVTFYKRDLASAASSESTCVASPASLVNWIGEVILDNPPRLLRAGQWFMLAGNLNVPDPLPPHLQIQTITCRWYRVIGASTLRAGRFQDVTVAGPDFDLTATNVTAWMFQGVIAVNEKNMQLEIE